MEVWRNTGILLRCRPLWLGSRCAALGRSGSSWLRHAVVRARQPVAEMLGRFGRRLTVEGHQRRRNARDPNDVGAPPILIDRTSFDQVGTPSNELFEAMDGLSHS